MSAGHTYRALTMLAVGAVIVLPIIYFVGQGRFLLAGLLVASVFLMFLFRRMDLWWMLAVATFASQLQLFSPQASVHLLSKIGLIGLVLVSGIILQGAGGVRGPAGMKRLVHALIVVIVITASIRGWGLRILGSANWGGGQYVVVLASLFFYLASCRIRLSADRISRAVFSAFVLGVFPALVVLILQVIPDANFLMHFIGLSSRAEGSTRLQDMQYPAIWLGVIAMLLYDRRQAISPAVIACAIGSFVLMGLSGHRTVAVLLSLTVLVYLRVRRSSISLTRYIPLVFALLVLLTLIYVGAGYLPYSFQRSLAWLPGLQVAYEASTTATATTGWRLEMWRMMLPMIPRYLVIGRGLGFDLAEAYSAYMLASDYDRQMFFIATHNYHNGPLWLLIDLGLSGFVLATALMVAGIFRYGKLMSGLPVGGRIESVYVVVYSFYCAYVIFFYTVIGFDQIFSEIMLLAAVLEVIVQSTQNEAQISDSRTFRSAAPIRPGVRQAPVALRRYPA